MNASEASYKQPTKAAIRQESIRHAVDLVTTRRDMAAVVPADYVARVRDGLKKRGSPEDVYAAESCQQKDITSWQTFRSQQIGTRAPDQITVAYLAGPEPRAYKRSRSFA